MEFASAPLRDVRQHGLYRFILFSLAGREKSHRPVATTLYELLPRDENLSSDNLPARFLDDVEGRRLTHYAAREEAVLELFEEKNVILNTPARSGKLL